MIRYISSSYSLFFNLPIINEGRGQQESIQSTHHATTLIRPSKLPPNRGWIHQLHLFNEIFKVVHLPFIILLRNTYSLLRRSNHIEVPSQTPRANNTPPVQIHKLPP